MSEKTDIDKKTPPRGVEMPLLPIEVTFPDQIDKSKYIPYIDMDGDDEFTFILKMIKGFISLGKVKTPILLKGPPGIGKTLLAYEIAQFFDDHREDFKIKRCPIVTMDGGGSISELDLLGMPILIKDVFWYSCGPIPQAIRAANEFGMAVLCINEINAYHPNTQIKLNSMLDFQSGVVIAQNNNMRIALRKGAHLIVVASMNENVLGVEKLQEALNQRFFHIDMPYPTPEAESKIFQSIGVPKPIADKYAEIAAELRKAAAQKEITFAPGPREMIKAIEITASDIKPMQGFKVTVASACGDDDIKRATIMAFAKGKGLDKLVFHYSPKIVPIDTKKKAETPKSSAPAKKEAKKDELDFIGDLFYDETK